MNIKIILLIFLSINTLKMLKKDSPIVLQNINMIVRQLFLLFKKSTTFWDNPRIILLLVSSSSGCLKKAVVFYCGTPWTFQIREI